MVHNKHGPEKSLEERTHRRMQLIYSGKMRERQVFMGELKQYRKEIEKKKLNAVIKAVGPNWYHVLSVPQRLALDTLEFSIYQDILEGRPVRTAKIIKKLGIYPHPNNLDLMNCVYFGREDPKQLFAHLFAMTYGHHIDGKRALYSLNAKLIMSAILYLGLDNLISLLRERFRPDQKEPPAKKTPKPKPEPLLESPYLQKMIAVLYEPPQRKPKPPPPLPNLDELNEPYDDEPMQITKPPPPPPPPPVPKKRLPRSYCDKLAGVMAIEPHSSITAVAMKTVTQTSHKRIRGSNLCLTEIEKSYGVSVAKKKTRRKRRPVAPNTGLWNTQYTINGVCQVMGRTVYILGNVSILPSSGDLIHGGYRYLGNECINIHCGYRASSPPPKPDPCDCLSLWQEKLYEYVKEQKCQCNHHYDYGNIGTFPPEELQYFEKPTKHKPYSFNYETIYDLNTKSLHVAKEFKRLWETDSMLHVDDGTVKEKKDTKKKKKRSSTTCLGQNPSLEDYLKCALRLMKRVNVAARLPDIHLVPELKEWMRHRLFGPYTEAQKREMLRQSSIYWRMFQLMDSNWYGHIPPPNDPTFSGHTTWVYKHDLNNKFRKYTFKYRLALFRSLAKVNNILWPSMYQAQFPDKKFREIYFSYLSSRVQDLQLMHPYSVRESAERKFLIGRKRYRCLPAGVEQQE